MTAVAILLPGIMGSVLKLGDEIIWPGPVTGLWLPYRKMKELLYEDLAACRTQVPVFVCADKDGPHRGDG